MKLKSFPELRQLLPDSTPGRSTEVLAAHDGRGRPVRIVLETKGRKGKSVTIVSGLLHNPATMKEIARMLKESCGSGGTVKNGTIELQGDHRAPAAKKLREMQYVVRTDSHISRESS